MEASRPPQLGFAIYIRLHLREFLVALVAQFGIALGGDEEFFGLLGEGLHQGVVADLAHDEVAELAQKKEHPDWNALKKIGGDLLFHKQVQYHRRCEA